MCYGNLENFTHNFFWVHAGHQKFCINLNYYTCLLQLSLFKFYLLGTFIFCTSYFPFISVLPCDLNLKRIYEGLYSNVLLSDLKFNKNKLNPKKFILSKQP